MQVDNNICYKKQPCFSFLVRSVSNFSDTIATFINSLLIASNKIFSTNISKATHCLGLTCAARIISGGMIASKNLQSIKSARKTNDVVGKRLAYLGVSQAGANSVKGAIAASTHMGSLLNSSTLLSLSKASQKLSLFSSLLGAVKSSLQLKEHFCLQKELKRCAQAKNTKYTDRLNHLQELLATKSSFVRRVLNKTCCDRIAGAEPSDAKEVVALIKKYNFTKIVSSSIILGLSSLGITTSLIALFIVSLPVTIIGLSIALISSAIKDVAKAIQEPMSSLSASLGINGVTLGTAMITGLGLYCLGATAVAPVMLGLLLAGKILISKTLGLLKAFKNNEPGRFDKLWLFLSSMTCLMITATLLAIASSPLLIASALVFGLICLSLHTTAFLALQTRS